MISVSRERYAADEVRAALTAMVPTVLAALGYETRGTRRLESARCPRALHSRRNAMGINPQKGLWRCYACDIGGDMFDLIAETRGLDARRDFAEVLAAAAAIVGIAPETDSADALARREAAQARIADEKRRQVEDAEREAQERADAANSAAAAWEQLPARSAEGERYLASRGLLVSKMQLGAVRFAHHGPSVALRSFDGEICNVVTRRYPRLGEPKAIGRKSCPTSGTLVGSIKAIGPGADVVLCEGVADALTATVVWPHAVALGAHGAGNMKAIASRVAPVVRRNGGRLLLVVDEGKAGTKAGIAAGVAAMEAGLRRDQDLVVVHLDGSDLNAAWQKGWRP